MRIVAIRGCNLASLAGEFELDLSRAPFAEAGVFAIVGNTGAGKSTLLDALCLALFDRTPRLTNHSRVVVGRGDDDPTALGAQDARTLLRRGAASGWAEVDFEGGDTRRYRARWSVRRARGRSDGTLQDQQITLVALDGGAVSDHLGGTKTETLKAIAGRLGLSFDQFRRSALLAQGEFAAFLRADGKDRSELLERMTGTEIYSRLSIAAHARATEAEQLLRDGRTAAFGIPVLDADTRRATEAELAIADDAKAAARARLATAETFARWHAESELRAAALVAAENEHARMSAAAIAASTDRRELELRQRAEKLRPTWAEVIRLERASINAARDVAVLDEAARDADREQTALVVYRDRISELHAPIRAARIAGKLVEREPERGPSFSSAESTRFSNGRRAAGHQERLDATEANGAAALGDASWIMARAKLADEVAAWSEIDARFAQHAMTVDALASIDRTLAATTATRTAQARARELITTEHAAAAAKLGEAQRKAQQFQQRRGVALDAARKLEDEARNHLLEIERLVAIAAGARQAVRAGIELARQLDELDVAAANDVTTRRDTEAARAVAVALRAERARVLDELRRAAGYDHARAELRVGEACPLCGALEHPWRDRGAFDDVIAAAQVSLDEAAAQLDATTTALATLDAREQHRGRERVRIASHHATAVASAASAIEAWRDHLAALAELMLVEDPASPAAEGLAAEREASALKRLEQARDTRRQTEAGMKAAADAQAEAQLCQLALDQIAARLGEADRALADLDATTQRLRGERSSRCDRHSELECTLRETVERWFAIDPGSDAPIELVRCRAVLAELATGWTTRAARVACADAALAGVHAAIDRELRDVERTRAECGARLSEATQRQNDLAAERAAATERLEALRVEAGFDADALSRLLISSDDACIDRLTERFAGLDRAVERSRAILDERAQLVAEHAMLRPDAADSAVLHADAIAHGVTTLAAAVVAADEHAARLATMIAADDEARARRAEAFAQLALAETASDADRMLAAVIGSHDGKLFRSFAQSLTLDGLLAVANAHLEELAPRYQLERVPRHDLELQVIDRDLGAEVRSVQSLSGGESFLVSLALALGLSSMSAHDVRVRTLLIDEGFGTLDPATLDSALSVLDALQATGRQVGVISHVPALVERVGAHVQVVQRGGGRSELLVPGAPNSVSAQFAGGRAGELRAPIP